MPGVYKTVQTRVGGGSRTDTFQKTDGLDKLLTGAKKLYFPDGTSNMGQVNEMEFDLVDISGKVLILETVQEVLDATKPSSKRITLVLRSRRVSTSRPAATQVRDDDYTPATEVRSCDLPAPSVTRSAAATPLVRAVSPDNTRSAPAESPTVPPSPSVPIVVSDDEMDGQEESDFQRAVLASLDDTREVVFGGLGSADDVLPDLDDTVPLRTSSPHDVKDITLHRGRVFTELNALVKSGALTPDTGKVVVHMVDMRGNPENGVDTGGLLRDALVEYWRSFYSRCSGRDWKVPVIAPAMTDVWERVAVIFVLGFRLEKYSPPELAPAFLAGCLDRKITDRQMMASFMEVVSFQDKDFIEEVQSNEDFDDWFGSDCQTFLEEMEVSTIPSRENWNTILRQAAHTTLVQKPAYVRDTWNAVFAKHRNALSTVADATKLKNKHVEKLIDDADARDEGEKKILGHLRKFIRLAREGVLRNFLRYATGELNTCTCAIDS